MSKKNAEQPQATQAGFVNPPVGTAPPAPPTPPVTTAPAPTSQDGFTPVQGGLFLNLSTGALHLPAATTRLKFKANGEPEWDSETGEQATEEIPVAEQIPGEELNPYRFNAVKLSKGQGDPVPMSEYEHPRAFPRANTVEAILMLIGAAFPVLSSQVYGDMDTPKDYKDRVYVEFWNGIQTNGPRVQFEIGELAISLMTDPNAARSKEHVRARLEGWLTSQGVQV